MFNEVNCGEKLDTLINKELKTETFPGIEILYAKGSEVLLHKTWGKMQSGNSSPLLLDTIFDIASLTKPVVTATLLLIMQEEGSLKLSDPVQFHLPEFAGRGKKRITLRHLLTHVSGLPAWKNLYESVKNPEEAHTRLMNIPLEYSPGEKMIYSCIGFLVLGEVIRKICGKDLSAVFYDKIAKPLKLRNSLFSPHKNRKNLNNVAPTAYCPIRNKVLHGMVHDENSFAFAEEGGNAGLFSTAKDLHRYTQMLLKEGELNDVRILTQESVLEMLKNQNPLALTPRGLGWEIKKPLSILNKTSLACSCGPNYPDDSCGHTGFTGTSLWFDPISKQIVIALSNRVNLSRENNLEAIKRFRIKLHGLLNLNNSSRRMKTLKPTRVVTHE
jgi:CubicO group peptidase (beta-lactamase class C family)